MNKDIIGLCEKGVFYNAIVVENLINKIFEDIKDSTCSHCEFSTQKDGNKYKCKKNVSCYYDDYNRVDFGCNLFQVRR